MNNKRFLNKKSQAALEFLTTYGWAFLVILIMIGTLAYFGILTPTRLLPNRCQLSTEFQCLDYVAEYNAGNDGTVKIRFKNNVGEPLEFNKITFSSDAGTSFTCTSLSSVTVNGVVDSATPYDVPVGAIVDVLYITCNPLAAGFSNGEKAKFSVTIEYNTKASGSGYGRQTKGEILTVMQA